MLYLHSLSVCLIIIIVSLLVCWSRVSVSPAETAELIEMLFGTQIRGGRRNDLLGESQIPCLKRNAHPFNGPLSGTTQVSRYQKGKTNLDFTEERDSEWQWNQLGHMQVCTSLQADNHASTPPLSFLQAGCPSCRPTNSIKALKRNLCR